MHPIFCGILVQCRVQVLPASFSSSSQWQYCLIHYELQPSTRGPSFRQPINERIHLLFFTLQKNYVNITSTFLNLMSINPQKHNSLFLVSMCRFITSKLISICQGSFFPSSNSLQNHGSRPLYLHALIFYLFKVFVSSEESSVLKIVK